MRARRDPKSRRSWLLAAALTALCLSILRASYLEKIGGEYTSCHGCFLVPALGRDAWLLCAMFAVLAFAAASPWRWPARIARVVAALGILAQATDLVLLRLFNQRLYIADLLRYSGDAAAGWSVARAQFFSINGSGYAAAAAIVLIVLAGLIVGGRGSPKQARILLVLAAIGALFAVIAMWMPLRYVHEEYVGNILKLVDVQASDSSRMDKMKEEIRGQLTAAEAEHQIQLWLERTRQTAFIHRAGEASTAGLPQAPGTR